MKQHAARGPLICLAGLPIDVVTMDEALGKVLDAVRLKRRLFVSTPNLNFMIAAQKDAAFRESILLSDLSLADGSSLVMLSRLMGCQLPERVTGSDLFERMALSSDHPPVKVFLFGGPPGAGALARERLNRDYPGVECVGHDEAGYGDVASMSAPTVIERINASGADFVLVALGAKKGQAWILHNQHKLTAPVISHLGAVINFMAGTVRRSPLWLQKLGLEWVWRIIQEPVLWRRYRDDGLAFLSLLTRRAMAATGLRNVLAARPGHQLQGSAELVVGTRGHKVLRLSGFWHQGNAQELFSLLMAHDADLQLDMQQVQGIDPYALGSIVTAHGYGLRAGGAGLTVGGVNESTRHQILSMGGGYLLQEAAPSGLINQEA